MGTTETDRNPNIFINNNMNNPDGTPGKLNLPNLNSAHFELDTNGPEAAHGRAVVTAPSDLPVEVAGDVNDVRLIERLPGSNTTRIVARDITATPGARNTVDISFVGPENVRFNLDGNTHGKDETRDKEAGIDYNIPVKDRGFNLGIPPVNLTTTINSDVSGKPGTQFTNENDKANYTIADNASGTMTVNMGSGEDTLTLNAKDGRLVTLDDGSKQFIRELAGKRFVMDIKGVENINVVFDSGPASTPTVQAAAPTRGEGR